MSSLAESRPQASLNDHLVRGLKRQEIKSIEALISVAHDYPGFEKSWATMEIIAKVWDDRGHLHGYVTEFERRTIMRTDKQRGANAIVLLIELRGIWRKRDTFALSARSPTRPIMPELGRDAFTGAVDLLLKTGCLVLVRAAVYDPHNGHLAAQYQLGARREEGVQPEMEKKAYRMPPKQQRASTAHTSQERASEPPRATEQEQPSTSPPEAQEAKPDLLVPETPEEKKLIQFWTVDGKLLTPERISELVAGRRAAVAEERATPKAEDDATYEGFSVWEVGMVAGINKLRKRDLQPPLTREGALEYIDGLRSRRAA
jgi:hypothetical protein